MTKFKTRINQSSRNSRIILANDYDSTNKKIVSQTIQNIKTLHKFLCGIKLNFHVLLPLGKKEIIRINKTAHQYGLQTIADIKLNDIGNTNHITSKTLWDFGFDAIIINPIMGPKAIRKIVTEAHKRDKGVIALCHMSAPEAKASYEINVKLSKNSKPKPLYQLFLKWAISNKADGIIVGATFPKIINDCKKITGKKLDIYSPGIGTQGGNAKKAIANGSDFLIVGRTILDSKDPVRTVKQLLSAST
ncbi:orotidine 5'-phosphate decarboxylase [Marine Group I thaumarchaeote]|uniref:Orotidine 5'-phosphate decarboxylase n=1 Tax=Marine Group I thaumarchaeote TaxID=2511932 RepID=A0A7K4MZJ5_9ARCH|nr:orotidine 5'-phosphate decarboxylase [Marine Group I thaumarchaeote]